MPQQQPKDLFNRKTASTGTLAKLPGNSLGCWLARAAAGLAPPQAAVAGLGPCRPHSGNTSTSPPFPPPSFSLLPHAPGAVRRRARRTLRAVLLPPHARTHPRPDPFERARRRRGLHLRGSIRPDAGRRRSHVPAARRRAKPSTTRVPSQGSDLRASAKPPASRAAAPFAAPAPDGRQRWALRASKAPGARRSYAFRLETPLPRGQRVDSRVAGTRPASARPRHVQAPSGGSWKTATETSGLAHLVPEASRSSTTTPRSSTPLWRVCRPLRFLVVGGSPCQGFSCTSPRATISSMGVSATRRRRGGLLSVFSAEALLAHLWRLRNRALGSGPLPRLVRQLRSRLVSPSLRALRRPTWLTSRPHFSSFSPPEFAVADPLTQRPRLHKQVERPPRRVPAVWRSRRARCLSSVAGLPPRFVAAQVCRLEGALARRSRASKVARGRPRGGEARLRVCQAAARSPHDRGGELKWHSSPPSRRFRGVGFGLPRPPAPCWTPPDNLEEIALIGDVATFSRRLPDSRYRDLLAFLAQGGRRALSPPGRWRRKGAQFGIYWPLQALRIAISEMRPGKDLVLL